MYEKIPGDAVLRCELSEARGAAPRLASWERGVGGNVSGGGGAEMVSGASGAWCGCAGRVDLECAFRLCPLNLPMITKWFMCVGYKSGI